MIWLGLVAMLVATAWLLYRMQPLTGLLVDTPGPRTRRLVLRRALLAMGLWEVSVALVLVLGQSWSLAVMVVGVGVAFIWWSRHPELMGA